MVAPGKERRGRGRQVFVGRATKGRPEGEPGPESTLMVSVMSSPFTSSPDLARLRDVVRASRLAIGLIAFPSRAFLEMSGPALEHTGLRPTETPVDLTQQTVAIVLMDVVDEPDRIAELLVGLESSLSPSTPNGRNGDNGSNGSVDAGDRLAELET